MSDEYVENESKIDINSLTVKLSKNEFVYSGYTQIPEVIISDLELDVDYSITVPNNSINKGKYNITVNGINNYEGSIKLEYEIKQKSISSDIVTLFGEPDKDECYKLENLKLMYNDIELILDTDYKYTYSTEEIDNGYIQTICKIKGYNNFTGSLTVKLLTERKNVYVGKMIELDNTPIYTRYCSNESESNKTGIFYLWDENVKNNRIRITNNLDCVGQYGFITGWINVDYLDNHDDKIYVGDRVFVNGNINSKSDGSGNIIRKNNNIMFVTQILDSNENEYNYALSTAMNRTNQGWAKEDMIKKIVD